MIERTVIETVVSDMNNYFKEGDVFFSKTRDIFTARLQSFIHESGRYLEAAIIGEIGNNTFDHNFGFISDYPSGVYCNLTYKRNYTVIADYGRGVKQSLMNVVPEIASDLEAVETAFTKRVSGRAPEQRGNGLKFVAETVQENNWYLYFQSGSGSCSINREGMAFHEKTFSLRGCLAIIHFDGDK